MKQAPTLLVVDDEKDLREAIAFSLRRKGYEVLCASGGKQAMDYVRSRKVDVVISDIRMPEGDGVALLRDVKELSPTLPVVMLITAYADLSLEEAYDRGADAVFSKPFDMKVLQEAIKKSLAPVEEAWTPRSERVEVLFAIELRFPDYDGVVKGKIMDIGRGGMFIALTDRFPEQSAHVSFKVNFEEDPRFSAISGTGIIRWIRKEAGPGKVPGIGVEFAELDESCRAQIVALIKSAPVKAFIPKG